MVSQYMIDDGRLTGHSKLSFTGEFKYAMTSSIRYASKTDVDRNLKNHLKCNNSADSILEIDIKGGEIGSKSLSISYKDLRPSCVRSFFDELYIDPDVFKDFAKLTIDTLKRKNDYVFPFSENYVSNIRLVIPEGYTVEGLDALVSVYSNDYGGFHSGYKLEGNKLFVSVNKIYEKSSVSVDKWGEMLQIAKKTNDFQEKTVILKKL